MRPILQRILPALMLVLVTSWGCSNDDDGTVAPSARGSIAGRVITGAGQPVAGVSIATTPATQAKVTADDGTFSIADVPAGSYVVTATKTGSPAGMVSVTVTSGKTATADIVLGGGGATNRDPQVPHSPSPAIDAPAQSTDLTLRWTSSDPDGDPLRYDVFFGTTEAPTLAASDLQQMELTRSDLAPNTRYYWRVVVRDNHGGEATSPLWSFTTGSNEQPDGLVAFYPFDGNAADATGHGLDGTMHGDARLTTDRNGRSQAALSVSGSGYVEVAHNAMLNFGSSIDFTTVAWIRTGTYQEEFAGIAAKMVGGLQAPFSGWQIFLSGPSFGAQVETVQARNDVFSTTNLVDNQWHMVALVVRRSTGSVRLYVDGSLVRDYTSPTVGANLNTTAPLLIGKDRTSNRFFQGAIDDIRIYNRALSLSELEALRL